MRLFFALWPDEATRSALDAWGAVMHKACGGRRVARDNIHATLAFLGERPEQELDAFRAAAATVHSSPFELVVDEAHYWKHNRIAWAGASAPPEQLTRLASSLREALSAAGLAFDTKSFVLHVTLLRDASAHREAFRFEPLRWRVENFALVRSAGGRYCVIGTWPLKTG